ncbi:hypothetical protein Tco_0695266 [Tanacetum coccineum]
MNKLPYEISEDNILRYEVGSVADMAAFVSEVVVAASSTHKCSGDGSDVSQLENANKYALFSDVQLFGNIPNVASRSESQKGKTYAPLLGSTKKFSICTYCDPSRNYKRFEVQKRRKPLFCSKICRLAWRRYVDLQRVVQNPTEYAAAAFFNVRYGPDDPRTYLGSWREQKE